MILGSLCLALGSKIQAKELGVTGWASGPLHELCALDLLACLVGVSGSAHLVKCLCPSLPWGSWWRQTLPASVWTPTAPGRPLLPRVQEDLVDGPRVSLHRSQPMRDRVWLWCVQLGLFSNSFIQLLGHF